MTREHEPLEATLRRLAAEREAADRTYNDALTALDTALLRVTTLPKGPAEYDEQQITPLNESWSTLVEPPRSGGLKGRLSGFVWRLVGAVAAAAERRSTRSWSITSTATSPRTARRSARSADARS